MCKVLAGNLAVRPSFFAGKPLTHSPTPKTKSKKDRRNRLLGIAIFSITYTAPTPLQQLHYTVYSQIERINMASQGPPPGMGPIMVLSKSKEAF